MPRSDRHLPSYSWSSFDKWWSVPDNEYSPHFESVDGPTDSDNDVQAVADAADNAAEVDVDAAGVYKSLCWYSRPSYFLLRLGQKLQIIAINQVFLNTWDFTEIFI